MFCVFRVRFFGQAINNAATIEFGSKNLSLEQPFLISVVLRDVENRPSVIFPEIKDLEKRSKSATSSMSTVDGKKVVIQTITQEYYASKPGNYLVPEFTVNINGQRLHAEESIVMFSSGDIAGNSETPFIGPSLDADFGNIDDGIFLSVQTDKREVYIRQGFALRISLYIAENAPVQMEFYRFNEQLQAS